MDFKSSGPLQDRSSPARRLCVAAWVSQWPANRTTLRADCKIAGCFNEFRPLSVTLASVEDHIGSASNASQPAGSLFYVLCHHRDDAFRVEWLATLIEMTSLGEGGCDLA